MTAFWLTRQMVVAIDEQLTIHGGASGARTACSSLRSIGRAGGLSRLIC